MSFIPRTKAATRQPVLRALAQQAAIRKSIAAATEDIAARLFRNGQTPMVAHHRRILAAHFHAMYPSALAWAEYCENFHPDADRAEMEYHLTDGIGNYDRLKEPVKKDIRKAFAKECADLRTWAELLLGWIERNQRVVDHAPPEQLDELNALAAQVEALAIPAGFLVLNRHRDDDGNLVERVTDGARYAILTFQHQHVGQTLYDAPHRAFFYRTAAGELGAVPYSEVTHFQPLTEPHLPE